jgi:predicted acetyltransferase
VTPIEVRACKDVDEMVAATGAIAEYGAWPLSREDVERGLRIHPLDRLVAALDDGRIVGGSGSFPFEMTVPGATVSTAGVTAVGVLPTHRRRGVLTAMTRAQLDDVHRRGEPLAALFASNERIYGRFGYGLAHLMGEIQLPRERSGFARPLELLGRVRIVDPAEALELLPPIWEQLRPETPGMLSRSREWWEVRVIQDRAERRSPGTGPKRFSVLEIDGQVAGYAIYRHAPKWEQGTETGSLNVIEAFALDPQATAELWRYLCDIEWVATINSWMLPLDHPLFFLLAEPSLMRFRIGDGLWVRLVDVGAALSARSYAADGEIVFEVEDAFCPWNAGRWKLEGGLAKSTRAAAGLACDVMGLGSVYLGGFTFRQLVRSGRIEELEPGAAARADGLFRTDRAPWCPENF